MMKKKVLLVCATVLLGYGQSFAQLDSDDFGICDHLGLGVGVGTTGITIDLSTCVTPYVGVRAGVDIMPKIKVSSDVDLKTESGNASMTQLTQMANQINSAAGKTVIDLSSLPNNQLPSKMDMEGKLSNTTFHFLVDVYPFPNSSSFHATVGAYFGSSEIVSLYNTEAGFLQPINQWNEAVLHPDPSFAAYVANEKMIGAELGNYFVTPNPADNGDAKATLEVKSFRPYVGLGFGRAVPKKRIGCQFDLGVQFWGKPEVFIPTYDSTSKVYGMTKIDGDKAGDTDVGKALKNISKISAYPVLSFRLVGRLL